VPAKNLAQIQQVLGDRTAVNAEDELFRRLELEFAGLDEPALVTGIGVGLSVYPSVPDHRHRLDVSLRLFLGRAAYFLFVTAYLSLLFCGRSSLDARTIPILLLALPVAFVLGFVRRLEPALRVSLWALLRRRPAAAAVELQLVAVLLIMTGVLCPQPARPVLAATAAVVALIARLVLHLDTRRLLRAEAAGLTPT
jgi:hypothetical protein